MARNEGMRVLIVDDDRSVVAVLEGMLGREPLVQHIQCVETAEAALTALQRYEFDLVFCDLKLPGTDGLHILRKLAQIGYSGAVALISGVDDRVLEVAADLARAQNLRVAGFFSKPIRRKHIQEALCRATALPHASTYSEAVAPSVDDLATAVSHAEIWLAYQPQVEVQTGTVFGFETLCRWRHPRLGEISPTIFIPLAEKNGRMSDITDFVCRETIRQGSSWLNAGFELQCAVNISVSCLSRPNLAEMILDVCDEYGFPPEKLTVELTESQLLTEATLAVESVSRLRLNGVELAIDDFGTGYASLEQLTRMPFQELKLDRAFVQAAGTNDSAKAILESSVELGRKLGLRIVSEGIETCDDWERISGLGCDIAQGFFLAEPMRAEQVPLWLRNWRPHGGVGTETSQEPDLPARK